MFVRTCTLLEWLAIPSGAALCLAPAAVFAAAFWVPILAGRGRRSRPVSAPLGGGFLRERPARSGGHCRHSRGVPREKPPVLGLPVPLPVRERRPRGVVSRLPGDVPQAFLRALLVQRRAGGRVGPCVRGGVRARRPPRGARDVPLVRSPPVGRAFAGGVANAPGAGRRSRRGRRGDCGRPLPFSRTALMPSPIPLASFEPGPPKASDGTSKRRIAPPTSFRSAAPGPRRPGVRGGPRHPRRREVECR